MASKKRTRTKQELISRLRDQIYNLQHEWKIADILGAKAARLKTAKKLIAAERRLDRMLGLPYRSYESSVFVGSGHSAG